ncbi:MAG TPA: DNA polymerase III subunit beta [Patescibacteria group bacterium]
MKAAVLQENFSKALSQASHFVNPHAQLPVLGNILLEANKTKLYVLSTNLEMSLSTSIGAKVEKEGKVAVPAKTIVELVSHLSKGTVDLVQNKEQLAISQEGFLGNVAGMNTNDFPSIPQSFEKGDILTLPKDDLIKSLSKVAFAVSQDETRPVLTGVLFLLSPDSLTLVASDGFRLSQKKIPAKLKGEGKVVIPKPALMELVKIASSSDSLSFQIKSGANQVVFGIGESDAFLATRIIEGEFPNFEKIIPKVSNTKVKVGREDLVRAVKIASVFAKDQGNIVKLTTGEGSLTVSAESSSVGNQKTKLDANVVGPSVEISFNWKFIEEVANAVEGEEIEIALVDTSSPGVFRDSKDPDFLHLIMPVKVTS